MIQVQDLHKTYRDGERQHPVLRGLSFEIATGDFVALLGRSGSGKSTLLNCLAGIETPDSGDVVLEGENLTRMDDDTRTRFRRDRIGIVFQFFNLLPVIPVLDNVLLPAELAGGATSRTRDRAIAMLDTLGLADRLHEFPDHLSGGEQQRVAIARALINEPRVLLADEPTGNLDSRTGADTLALLDEVHREHGLTIVMATHSREAAASARRVVSLKDGRLVNAL